MSHDGKTDYHSPTTRFFQDGVFTILMVRAKNVSRYRPEGILLGFETGSHVDIPGVEWIKGSAYRLELADPSLSFNDIDSECAERGPVQGMCFVRVSLRTPRKCAWMDHWCGGGGGLFLFALNNVVPDCKSRSICSPWTRAGCVVPKAVRYFGKSSG